MTIYEFISILLSLVAILISFFAWNRDRPVKQSSNKFQRRATDHPNAQQNSEGNGGKTKPKSNISVQLIHVFNDNYKFEITNNTKLDVKNVEMELLLKDPKDSPISADEYASKLPIRKLLSGTSVTVLARLYPSSPKTYNAVLKWTDSDGARVKDEVFVSV